MKRSRIVAVLVAPALGLCIWAAATAQEFARNRGVSTNGYAAHPAAPATARAVTPPNSGPDFNGKLVALSVRGGNQPRLLERARFADIHGRRFLVGQEAKATFSFPVGTPAHIAWDAVDAFYVFDSVAQYEQALRQALEQAQGTVGEMLGGFLSGAGSLTNGGFRMTPTITTDGSVNYPAPTLAPMEYPSRGVEPTEATSPSGSAVPRPEPRLAPNRVYSQAPAGR